MPSGSPELEESHSVLTYGSQEERGWERSETNNGIPYYIKHDSHETQWDHPEMSKALHKLDEINNIEYAAYRTAMKIRTIQKVCWLHVVKKHALVEAWGQHGLGDDQEVTVTTPAECEAVLQTVFTLSKGDRPSDILDPDRATQLTLSWLLGLVDSGRTGNINVQMAKIGLMSMCSAKLEEKYEYMFSQMVLPKKHMSMPQLRTVVQHTLLLPKQVFESASFGPDQVEPAVNSCYKLIGKQRGQAIGAQDFLVWMIQEPRFIVWLPTMHRLAASETVKHEGRCATCKAFPIIGLRFRCLKAFNTDLCQNCYLTKKLPKNVKPSHPFREYSVATSSGDDIKDFSKVLRNKVTRRYRGRQPKKSYLDYPVTADDQPVVDGGENFEESFVVVEADQLGPPSQQHLAGDVEAQEPLIFRNRHARIGQLAGRLQELESQDGPTPRVVAAEIHTQTDEEPDLHKYQPVSGDTTVRTYSNSGFMPTSPTAQSQPSVTTSRPQIQREREVSPSVHFDQSAEERSYPYSQARKEEYPSDSQYRVLPKQPTHKPYKDKVTGEQLLGRGEFPGGRGEIPAWNREIPVGKREIPVRPTTPLKDTFISPNQSHASYTDYPPRHPQPRTSYYASVLPREDINNAELRAILANLVAQKDALVQDLQDLKGSATFLSNPAVTERSSSLDPSFYHLQKDLMSTRLEAKEQHIRQLEHQLQALKQMIADKEREVKPQPQQEQMQTSTSTGRVSRGVNISTSVMSDLTERSFFGNPEEDLANLVQGMVMSFPTVPGKVQPDSMDSEIYQAAMKVSQNFTSYSQELKGN